MKNHFQGPDYLKGKRGYFIFPAILAGLTIFVMAIVWNISDYGIIFACFGSSTYIVYVTPRSKQASMPNILGAYPLAGFFGYATIEYLLPMLSFEEHLNYAIAGGVAVGITILAMIVTGFEHAPAAGAALAFVLKPTDVKAVFLLIGGGITLLVLAKVLTLIVKEELAIEDAIRHALHPKSK
ncbi:MAG: hypothetical protein DRO90_02650 [Candidatus Altiarchaeales archaeon]|nr:MAG: hypothetical protein DRO95_01725 [Candidatus Altiarchaeales archaeon]RLI94059.1 MAG: hypothetical protein DRO90_02650 [Candidatus Altiarchaeales archaeon]RLI94829.1 MAG: hypothetical protein DRO94_01960 [Candidatus Altiarchaeales archaeon]HDO82689.1 HPP family protein [Candidatus Altiarchaeales archaeon]HEX55338.1 HPP family protein [Candidatus Altiarchaeales archaeon]